jgi:hypothetical protein
MIKGISRCRGAVLRFLNRSIVPDIPLCLMRYQRWSRGCGGISCRGASAYQIPALRAVCGAIVKREFNDHPRGLAARLNHGHRDHTPTSLASTRRSRGSPAPGERAIRVLRPAGNHQPALRGGSFGRRNSRRRWPQRYATRRGDAASRLDPDRVREGYARAQTRAPDGGFEVVDTGFYMHSAFKLLMRLFGVANFLLGAEAARCACCT